MSNICPVWVQHKTYNSILSKVFRLDRVWTNSGCWLRWLKMLLMSKVCPHPEFVQTLSNQEFMVRFEDPLWRSLDKPWMCLSNLCPKAGDLDRALTDIGPLLDSVLTNLVHGQALDRVLTDIGQRLDFPSNLCPRFVWPPFSKEYPKNYRFTLLPPQKKIWFLLVELY